MTVSIDIDLSALDAHVEIEKLRTHLESLDDDLDFDFEGSINKKISEMTEELQEMDTHGGGGGGGGGGRSRRNRGGLFDGLKRRLRRLIPDMNTFYTIFAALIPLLVVLGTQLLGVAAAMGAVAVAGASIIGLGLVGHGEDMASSMKNAKQQIKELGQELFNVFQPTMQTFAPIQEQFFDTLPGQLNKIATAMEGLTVYSDTLFQALGGITDWIENGIQGMVKYEDVISQLALRFGEIIGTNINSFFRFLLKEGYENQEMLITLGKAFKDVIVAIYHVSKVIVRVVNTFAWLGALARWIADILDNKLVVGILAAAAAFTLTVYVITSLISVTTMLAALWSGGLVASVIAAQTALEAWIFNAILAQIANYGLAASIATVVSWATLGVGALMAMGAAAKAIDGINSKMEMTTGAVQGGRLPGGGPGASGPGAGGQSAQSVVNHGDTYNVNVQGDMDNATEEGMADMFKTEQGISQSRQPPDAGGS